MVELVIVLAIMGILAVTVIPMYSQMQAKSQFTRNTKNMEIIGDAFLSHFYYTYSMGTPAVPTPPIDSLMTDDWCNTPMDSSVNYKTPNDLFGTGEVPKNIEDLPVVFVVDAGFNLIAEVVPILDEIWFCVVVICPAKVALLLPSLVTA